MKVFFSLSLLLSFLLLFTCYLPNWFTRHFLLSDASMTGRRFRLACLLSPVAVYGLAVIFGFFSGLFGGADESNVVGIVPKILALTMFTAILIAGPMSVIFELARDRHSENTAKLFVLSIWFALSIPIFMTLFVDFPTFMLLDASLKSPDYISDSGFRSNAGDVAAFCDFRVKAENERVLYWIYFDQVLETFTLGFWDNMKCATSQLEPRPDSPRALFSVWLTNLLTELLILGNLMAVFRRAANRAAP